MVSIYFFNNKTLFLHTKSIPCIKRPLNKRRKKTTASIFRHIMSAVGTTLLQSPGWNEDKARYVTLGIHREKKDELRRSGTNRASISFALWFVPPRWGSINVFQ